VKTAESSHLVGVILMSMSALVVLAVVRQIHAAAGHRYALWVLALPLALLAGLAVIQLVAAPASYSKLSMASALPYGIYYFETKLARPTAGAYLPWVGRGVPRGAFLHVEAAKWAAVLLSAAVVTVLQIRAARRPSQCK
jgi:hypothetical protein